MEPENPPSLTPDTKDWTWVLERACPECGFDAQGFPRGDVGAMVRDNAASWELMLRADDERLARRPRDEQWSALEYACHVRDVLRIYSERLDLMVTEDGPEYPNWDQDETAVAERYDRASPSTVADELAAIAAKIAAQFDAVTGKSWQRTGFRSDGAAFTIESFARYFIHDPIHHLHDARVGFEMM